MEQPAFKLTDETNKLAAQPQTQQQNKEKVDALVRNKNKLTLFEKSRKVCQ